MQVERILRDDFFIVELGLFQFSVLKLSHAFLALVELDEQELYIAINLRVDREVHWYPLNTITEEDLLTTDKLR